MNFLSISIFKGNAAPHCVGMVIVKVESFKIHIGSIDDVFSKGNQGKVLVDRIDCLES